MKPLQELQTKLIEEAHLLYEALIDLEADDANIHAAALTAIQNYLQEIAASANRAQLKGLPNLCQQAQQQLEQLPFLPSQEKSVVLTEFERWPRLIANYLYSPTDSEVCQQLITSLQRQGISSIPATVVKEITTQLTTDFNPHRDQKSLTEQPMVSMPMTSVSVTHEVNGESMKTDIAVNQGVTAQVVHGETTHQQLSLSRTELSNQLVDKIDTLTAALNQLVTQSEESETFLEGIEQYTNTIQGFWEIAEVGGLKGFQQICTFINDNIFEYSSLSQPQRFKLREHFSVWPHLVLDYLQNPQEKNVTRLLDYFSSKNWPTPLSTESAKKLAHQLFLEVRGNQDSSSLVSEPFSEEISATVVIDEAASAELDTPVSAPEVPQVEEMPLPMFELPAESGESLADTLTWNAEDSLVDEWLSKQWGEDEENVEEWALPAELAAAVKAELEDELTKREETLASQYQAVAPVVANSHTPVEVESTSPAVEVISATEFNSSSISPNITGKIELTSSTVVAEAISPSDETLLAEFTASSFLEESTAVEANVVNQERQVPDDEQFIESVDKLTVVESKPSSDVGMPSVELAQLTEADIASVPRREPELIPTSPVVEMAIHTPIVHQNVGIMAIQLASPQILDLMVMEIREAQNDLSTALNKLVAAKDEESVLLEAVEQYTDNVQAIAETAQKSGLLGLPEIGVFINDNLFELSTRPYAIRRAAMEHIESWPRLVLAYLHHPVTNAQKLVAYLQSPVWPLALNELQSQELLAKLLRCELKEIQDNWAEMATFAAVDGQVMKASLATVDASDDALQEAVFSSPTTSSDANETVLLPESDVLPKTSVVDATEDESVTVTMIAEEAELPDTTSNLEMATDSSSVPKVVSTASVVEAVPEIVLAAPEVIELLVGQVLDIIEPLTATLTQLVAAEEGGELVLTAVESYTEQVQAIWDAAEMAGLEGLQEICTFINNNVMMFGGLERAARSHGQDVLANWPEKVVAYLQSPAIAIEPLLEHLQQPSWPTPLDSDAVVQLRLQLSQSKIQPAASPANKEVVVKPIILADPDILALLIGQVTDVEGELSKLLEPLMSAAAGSEPLLTTVESYTEQVQAIWDAADLAKLGGLQQVCTFINDNIMLLSGLTQSDRVKGREVLAQWPLQVIAYLQEPASAVTQLLALLKNAVWPAPLADETSLLQQLIPTATDATVSSENRAEIILVAPDVLELVCNQVNDVRGELSAALEVCVSMENDNPAFLEAIENYTNQVQAIWDAAEMAGLKGLQEVCTFINDNLLAFSAQEKEQKLISQAYLLKWPEKVLAYLQTPATGAANLVSFMQEAGWPVPLTSETAANLLNLLTTPAQSASTADEGTSSTEATPVEMAGGGAVDLPPVEVKVNGEISLGNAEVVEILKTELEYSKEDFGTALAKFTTLEKGNAALADITENYTDQVMRLNAAAEIMGLEGLKTIGIIVCDNVKALSTQEVAARVKAKPVLTQWPDLILDYLKAPAASIASIVNHFRQPAWAQPLTEAAANALATQLATGSTAQEEEEEQTAYTRQTVANPEDVLLTVPEDINRDLLDAYLQETPQYTADFSASIQNIIQNPEISEIERAKRIAHTLKGSSNIIGIKGIANIAHHLEDTLEFLAKHKVTPPKELTDTMVEAADCLEMMVEALLGREDAPTQAQQVLQSVLDWANRIDKGKLDAPPATARPTTPTPAKAEPAKEAKESKEAKDEGKQAKAGADAGTPENFLRVPTKTVDELMRLVGELSISLGQIQEKLRHIIQSTRNLNEQDLVLQHKTFALETLVDVRGITGVNTGYRDTTESDEDFDPLEFEEYNELHSVAHSFIESIADNRELALSIREELSELETMFIHQERLSKEFQANIMTTRMVPVSTIFSKLQRNVRQTCRMTGKKVELEVVGTDILIDSDVLNNLGDPLQHILRNSIDHGIEAADERVLLGKPESGTIRVSFYREGNNIVVKCEDDGQGLNYTNIRYTAIQRGLITENQELTEQELSRLILMSGFSTKSGVTQVSGRGVGMDVVHTNIRQMKGTLDLISKTGKGMTILIKLPMTLVTVHVLLVRVGAFRFGIPTNNLEQALAPGVGEFQKVGNELSLKIGKHLYALKKLGDLLNIASDREGMENMENLPLILAREETGITAVMVDELIDTHDLVMKSMGKYVKKVHGVTGAAILGDGTLVPLLDLPELLRSPMQAVMSSYLAEQGDNLAAGGKAAVPQIMVVDDSLSVRKSLSLLLEEAGFETLLAKDGLEAIEIVNQTRPQVMLVDMEMPRMNGLELTAHIRANQATQNLPIFMITSRTTEKHREQAKAAGVSAYLTKPYQDAELLDLIDKALAGKIH